MKRTVLSIFLLGLFCSNVNGMNVDGESSFAPSNEHELKIIENTNAEAIEELDGKLNAELDEEYEKKIALDNEVRKIPYTFNKLWNSFLKKLSYSECLDAIYECIKAINKITDYCKELRESALKMVICEIFLENCEDNGRFLNDTISYIKKEYLQDTDNIDNLVECYTKLGGSKRIKIYLYDSMYSFFDLYSKVLISGVEKFTDPKKRKTIEDRYRLEILNTMHVYVLIRTVEEYYSEEDGFDPIRRYYFCKNEEWFQKDPIMINYLKNHTIGGVYIEDDDALFKKFSGANRFSLINNQEGMGKLLSMMFNKTYYEYVCKLDDADAKYNFQYDLLIYFYSNFPKMFENVVIDRWDFEDDFEDVYVEYLSSYHTFWTN